MPLSVQLTVIAVPSTDVDTLGAPGFTAFTAAVAVPASENPALFFASTDTEYEAPGSPVAVHGDPANRLESTVEAVPAHVNVVGPVPPVRVIVTRYPSIDAPPVPLSVQLTVIPVPSTDVDTLGAPGFSAATAAVAVPGSEKPTLFFASTEMLYEAPSSPVAVHEEPTNRLESAVDGVPVHATCGVVVPDFNTVTR